MYRDDDDDVECAKNERMKGEMREKTGNNEDDREEAKQVTAAATTAAASECERAKKIFYGWRTGENNLFKRWKNIKNERGGKEKEKKIIGSSASGIYLYWIY